jgi:hypothetical protein
MPNEHLILDAIRMPADRPRRRGHSAVEADGPPVVCVLADGRVLCVERDGVGTIVWSHDAFRVVPQTSSSEDWKTLYRFWSTVAGPSD